MSWTNLTADDIGEKLPIEMIGTIYNNFKYLHDRLLAVTQRDASITAPDISAGRNTALNKIQSIMQTMENNLGAIHDTAAWANPYYNAAVSWETLTANRRSIVVRWVECANYMYDELNAE